MTERYEFRIRGRLSPAVAATFEGLAARADHGETVLEGLVTDQAELYGVLDRIQALGLELVEVRLVSPRQADENSLS
jgi:hypothetical protein